MHLFSNCKIKIQELSRSILNCWTQIWIMVCVSALLGIKTAKSWVTVFVTFSKNRLFLNNTKSALHHPTFEKYVFLTLKFNPSVPSNRLTLNCTSPLLYFVYMLLPTYFWQHLQSNTANNVSGAVQIISFLVRVSIDLEKTFGLVTCFEV